MKTAPGILALGALLVVLPLSAQARPSHHHKEKAAANASARHAATDGFSARMSRLDALMGMTSTARTRSASADH